MKKVKELLAVIMVCIVLCGVNTGIETCGQDGLVRQCLMGFLCQILVKPRHAPIHLL